MILRTGDMWTDSRADVILFTGNASVRADGALVMGRGAALEAQTKFPGLSKRLGKLISSHTRTWGGPYGIFVDALLCPIIGVFQVKYRWAEKAEMNLIRYSTEKLTDLTQHVWSDRLIALNFPGTGFGRLKREDVLSIIKSLPDNVEIWERVSP